MANWIDEWKKCADGIAARVVVADQKATADDLRTIAVVAAIVLVVERLDQVCEGLAMAGRGF